MMRQAGAEPDSHQFRALRQPVLVAVLAAQVVSITGSQVSALAVPWFVLATTGSTARMGLVAAVEMLAMAVFAVPGGAVATRLGAWRTMLASDALRGVLVALIPLLHALGVLPFPALLALIFLVGGFFAPYSAAQSVLLTDVVGDDERRVSEASSWLQGASRLTIMLGPAVAGLLIGVMGAPNLLWIDAATFFVAFALVRLFVPRADAVIDSESAAGALAGLRHIARDRLLRNWGIATCGFEFAWQIVFLSIPAYAFVRFHSHPVVAGLLFGLFGLTSTLGNVLSARFTRRGTEPVRLVRNAKLIQIPVFWVLVVTVSAPALAAVLAVAGLCNGLLAGPVNGVELARTPAALRPKVMTALLSASLFAGALGTAAEGWILHIGFRTGFLVAALAHTVFGALFIAGVLAASPKPAAEHG